MSDTPRTDDNICDHFWNGKGYVEAVTADFAREIERELAAKQEQLDDLADAAMSLVILGESLFLHTGMRVRELAEPTYALRGANQ
jgi:hypothetical protein